MKLRHHNPASVLLRAREECEIARRDHWGKQHAILARLDGAVHKSRVFGQRTLAPRTSFRPQRRFGVLSDLWQFVAGSTSANWTKASNEAASVGRQASIATEATLDFFVSVAP